MMFLGAPAVLFGAAGLAAKLIGGATKPPPQVQPLPMVTRDDAADQVAAQDAVARRQGSAADMLTGSRGAAALTSGSTGKLVLGN